MSTLAVCLLLTEVKAGQPQKKETKKMSDRVAVELQSPQGQPFRGPVSVWVILTNVGSNPINVLLPYPNPNNLAFKSVNPGVASAKVVEKDPIERTAPIIIQPGQTYKSSYFLNRYVKFLKEGSGDFSYSLRMRVSGDSGDPPPETKVFTGTFRVQLMAQSESQLRSALATYADQLKSPNRKEKMEAAEALAFVDTPLVVTYLLPMLQIDNLEVIGIRALARHPGPQSEQAIKSMLGHEDSAVVGAALEEIDRLRIPVNRKEVQHLLESRNPNIQWLALGWLSARPSSEDLPLLAPLLNSTNPSVRERADDYQNQLRQKR